MRNDNLGFWEFSFLLAFGQCHLIFVKNIWKKNYCHTWSIIPVIMSSIVLGLKLLQNSWSIWKFNWEVHFEPILFDSKPDVWNLKIVVLFVSKCYFKLYKLSTHYFLFNFFQILKNNAFLLFRCEFVLSK